MPEGFHPDCPCKADPPAFQGIISPFSYAYPVDQLIKRFKEQGHLAAGKLVSLLLAEHLRNEPLKIDRLIPIPSTQSSDSSVDSTSAISFAKI